LAKFRQNHGLRERKKTERYIARNRKGHGQRQTEIERENKRLPELLRNRRHRVEARRGYRDREREREREKERGIEA